MLTVPRVVQALSGVYVYATNCIVFGNDQLLFVSFFSSPRDKISMEGSQAWRTRRIDIPPKDSRTLWSNLNDNCNQSRNQFLREHNRSHVRRRRLFGHVTHDTLVSARPGHAPNGSLPVIPVRDMEDCKFFVKITNGIEPAGSTLPFGSLHHHTAA